MTKPADPATCPHKFVRLIERWYGQGKYHVFQCSDCDAILVPDWKEWKLDEPKG